MVGRHGHRSRKLTAQSSTANMKQFIETGGCGGKVVSSQSLPSDTSSSRVLPPKDSMTSQTVPRPRDKVFNYLSLLPGALLLTTTTFYSLATYNHDHSMMKNVLSPTLKVPIDFHHLNTIQSPKSEVSFET